VRDPSAVALRKQESSVVVYRSLNKFPTQFNKDGGDDSRQDEALASLGTMPNISLEQVLILDSSPRKKTIEEGNNLISSFEIEGKDKSDPDDIQQNL